MNDTRLTREYGYERLSISCLLVSTVFFLVLSQAFIIGVPDIVTQVFRPLIVIYVFIQATKMGRVLFSNIQILTILTALMCALSLFLHNIDEATITECVSDILYLLMFLSVTMMPWNKREVKTIIFACFAGAVLCAVIMLMSNPITDYSVAANGDVAFLNVTMNRNKNAYAFNVGALIGLIYLIEGKNIPKFLVSICTAVLIYALVYSQCRGAFFSFVGGCAILAIGHVNRVKKVDTAKALRMALSLIVIAIIAYLILKNSPLSRLIDGESKSGRDSGIKEAWGLFLNADPFSKLFGCGFTFETNNMSQIRSHLVYTCFLLNIGLIGTTFLVILFISIFRTIKGYIPMALFILGFMRTFFELLDYYIYIPFILAIIIHNYVCMNGSKSKVLFSRKV